MSDWRLHLCNKYASPGASRITPIVTVKCVSIWNDHDESSNPNSYYSVKGCTNALMILWLSSITCTYKVAEENFENVKCRQNGIVDGMKSYIVGTRFSGVRVWNREINSGFVWQKETRKTQARRHNNIPRVDFDPWNSRVAVFLVSSNILIGWFISGYFHMWSDLHALPANEYRVRTVK